MLGIYMVAKDVLMKWKVICWSNDDIADIDNEHSSRVGHKNYHLTTDREQNTDYDIWDNLSRYIYRF